MDIDIKNLKPLKDGEGSCGKCYILNENTLYKEFYPVTEEDFIICEKELRPLVGIINDTFVFPIELNIKYGILLGYTMRYVKGVSLKNLNHDIFLYSLIYALPKVYEDIEIISKKGILLYDISDDNILFDGTKLSIIDQDRSTIIDNPRLALMYNRRNFNQTILCYICEQTMQNREIEKFISSDVYLNYIYEGLNQGISNEFMIEFLETIREKLFEVYGDVAINVKDIKKILEKK